MNFHVHRNRATSRHSGQCRDVRANVVTLRSNVATFQRVKLSTLRRWDPMFCQRCNVEVQRRDVIESCFFQLSSMSVEKVFIQYINGFTLIG